MHRIPLGNSLSGGKNNAYFFPVEPVTLVDTGIADTASRVDLEDGLAKYGFELGPWIASS